LRDEGLTAYYALAGDAVAQVGAPPGPRGHAWLEPLLAGAQQGTTEVCALDLDVQGIHCAACVWLMNETFRRAGGGLGITVNPALGKVRLVWRRGGFDVEAWLSLVERFGYQFGPSRKGPSAVLGSLTWRLGVVAALSMNVMLFSLSFYFGLSPAESDIYPLFSALSLALSTAVVAIGGWPFFRAALRGLHARMLHLDLPIALGILLVYGTSLAELARGRGGAFTYFDTLNAFVTLMLLGRFLQQRLLERNRRFLLDDDGAEDICVRRLTGDDRIDVVPAPRLRRGDRLLIAPGELVPIDATVIDGAAAISADWITGEAAPRAVAAGDTAPAGSFNAGHRAFAAVAETDFADSPLSTLLRQTETHARAGDGADAPVHLRFWDRLARRWVAGVLVAAAAGLALWLPRGGTTRALDVIAALLVVTCPCGVGIALPLAYELVQARLRRAGFFVRAADLMDRLVRVRTLVFDKTGTLTLSRLELANPAAPARLDVRARDVAYNLACRSSHPVSTCLADALAAAGARFDSRAAVTEHQGSGLSWRRPDGEWRLGRASWAAYGSDGDAAAPVLAHDGSPVAAFPVREVLRAGAVDDLAVMREAGFDLWIVSGDTAGRAARLAAEVGVPAHHVRAGRSPADKARDVVDIDAGRALFLGDGANDALAFGQALCAGTVAIDRPVLPGRSDFFLVGPHLGPLHLALAAARRLRRVARQVLVLSLAYNVLAVTAALLGTITPVRAAIFMPLSSLSLLLFTVARLSDGSARARRSLPATAPVLEPAA
jgi:Cu2+-exporting ATPase